MADVRPGATLRAGPAKRRIRLRERSTALGAAVVIHLGLFVFAFATASGDLVSAAGAAGGEVGPAFAVTLVRLSDLTGRAATADAVPSALVLRTVGGLGAPIYADARPATDPLSAMVHQLRSAASPLQAPDVHRLEGKADLGGAPHPSPALPSRSERPTEGHSTTAEGEAAGAASTGALWGAIEPCWRNLGVRGRVPVVLEVALNGVGALRGPPKVVRNNTAPIDEPRLQAEAGALAAIAACAPRGNLALAGRTYRLEFPAAPP